VVFERVVKDYPGGVRAVDDVSLEIPRGAFAVLVGPSGCGKTTLLKTVNRLYEPTSGRVLVDGEDAQACDPVALRRRIGYVIQQVGLFPHMTVAENIGVVPELSGWGDARIAQRVDELLALVNLEPGAYRSRYPAQLSGGQQQRVGLARALAVDPAILLMDEPFGAIDAIERERLQDELAALHSRLRKTVLFVTHDVEEALKLADLLVVMRAGRIEQSGTPLEIMTGPANVFVGSLVDADDVLRRFSLMRVDADATTCGAEPRSTSGFKILAGRTLRDALATMVSAGVDSLQVVDAVGAPMGAITLADLRRAARPASK
jgi:osmoprotectant transport system ATP-binding protein